MSELEICQICCDKFTKSRKKVNCPYCDFECCKSCIQHYILNQEIDNCMNCRKSLSMDFLSKHLNKTFLQKEYKKHKKTLLFNTEISKIPSTIPLVEHKNETDRIKSKLYEKNKLLHQIKNEISQINIELYTHLNKDITRNKKEFKLPCPKDKCKGFLNSKYICGICGIKSCSKCREIIVNNEEHICNEELVKTIELIKKENKNCPKCAISIYKISGCDQMWCTQCNVAFSWRTGKITNGPIHNPHFYQAQQLLGENINNQNDNNQNDNLNCNNLINNYNYRVFISNISKFLKVCLKSIDYNSDKLNILLIIYEIFHKLHRATLHNQAILNRLENDITNLNNNDEIRVKYMTDELNDSRFTQLVFNRYNKLNKKLKLREILEMYINIITETINNLYLDLKNKKIEYIIELKKEKIINYYDRIIKISNYTNENLKKIGISFNNTKTYEISHKWELNEQYINNFSIPFTNEIKIQQYY